MTILTVVYPIRNGHFKMADCTAWRAMTAELWKRRSVLKPWAISRTNLWNGSFLIKSSVLFWYLLISHAMLHSTLVTLSLFYRPSYAMLHSTLVTLSLFYRHSYAMFHSTFILFRCIFTTLHLNNYLSINMPNFTMKLFPELSSFFLS